MGEVKELVQGHVASKQYSKDLSPGNVVPDTVLLISILYCLSLNIH